MSGAEAALESAILAVLGGDAGVTEVLGDPLRVTEEGAPRPAFPYLELVRHQSEPAGSAGVEASSHRVDFAVVSRRVGGTEAMEAMAILRAALKDAVLEMEGWRCVLLLPVFLDATRTRPGLWRALLRVKAVIETA